MFINSIEIKTIKFYQLPYFLRFNIVKELCETIHFEMTDSFFNKLENCKVYEAEIYVPDLFTKYIHTLA